MSTESDLDRIRRDYLSGMPMQAIGDRMGVTRQRIHQIISRHMPEIKGCRPSRRKSDDRKLAAALTRQMHIARREMIAEDYRAGMKQVDIAGKHGVCQSWVSQVLIRHYPDIPKHNPPGRRRVLDDQAVDDIRDRYGRGDIRQSELAGMYGVSASTISNILAHKRTYGERSDGSDTG